MFSIQSALNRKLFLVISDRQILVLWLSILFIYRIAVINTLHVDVFFDEAYYYFWSQNIEWGYYSKPPVVAWLIAISTALFGPTELGLKIFSPLLYTLTGYVVFEFAKTLYSERIALLAAVIFSSTPLIGFNSLFITTDAPLLFFWSITCLYFVRALNSTSLSVWVLLGIYSGLGLLSKYSFIVLLFGLLLFVILQGRFRLLYSPRCLVALFICIALFSTNLIWNGQHNFIAFSHTRDIAQLNKSLFHFDQLAEFLLAQVIAFGLVWTTVVVGTIHTKWNCLLQNDRMLLLACITVPILLIIAIQAFLSRAFVNWAAPFVIGASIITALTIIKLDKKVLILGLLVNLLLLSLAYHWPQLLELANVPQHRGNSPYYRLAGWREVSFKCEQTLSRYPQATVVSDSRELLSYIGFYNGLHISQLSFWNPQRTDIANHYDLLSNIGDIKKRDKQDYLFLSAKPISFDIQQSFEQINLVEVVRFQFNTEIHRKVYIYHAVNFEDYPDAEKI